MNINNKSDVLYKYYSSFTTPQLKTMLKSDFYVSDKKELSSETIETILNILHSRENVKNENFNIDDGWNSFKLNYLPFVEQNSTLFDDPTATTTTRKAIKAFYKKREFAAAIVIGMIMTGIFSTTTTAQNLFSYIANWTKETFWFNENNSSTNYNQSKIKSTLANDYDFSKIPDNLLPTWLPDGFVQKDLTGYENSSEKVVYISFENEENHSFLNITISYLYAEVSNIYEKDNTKVTIYQKNGIDYYLLSNLNTNTAIWKNDSFECQIDGDISIDELKQIIDSIP